MAEGDRVFARFACGVRVTGGTNYLSPRHPVTLSPSSVEIWPEPSPEERLAILIALDEALPRTREAAAPQISAWAAAVRREAMRAREAGGSSGGWDRERLAAW